MDCDRCGLVVDWGDFGPDPDDGSVGATCTCEPEPELVVWLRDVTPWELCAPFSAPKEPAS